MKVTKGWLLYIFAMLLAVTVMHQLFKLCWDYSDFWKSQFSASDSIVEYAVDARKNMSGDSFKWLIEKGFTYPAAATQVLVILADNKRYADRDAYLFKVVQGYPDHLKWIILHNSEQLLDPLWKFYDGSLVNAFNDPAGAAHDFKVIDKEQVKQLTLCYITLKKRYGVSAGVFNQMIDFRNHTRSPECELATTPQSN